MKILHSIIIPIFAFALIIFSLTFLLVIAFPFMTENAHKRFILANQDKIIHKDKVLVIPITPYKYYKNITLRIVDPVDSSYQIVLWGDRESILWRFKLDKQIHVTIPYDRYKHKNVELDKMIFELIKENN